MIYEKTIEEVKEGDLIVPDIDLFMLGGRYLITKITNSEIITERWDCGKKGLYHENDWIIDKKTYKGPLYLKGNETLSSWKSCHKVI
jgi:hypothetical protein